MARSNKKYESRKRRKMHIRKTVRGTAERPRLNVFRSARHIYAQLIDDDAGHTLVSASSLAMKIGNGGGKDGARAVGLRVGELAREAGISHVVFDRNGCLYHGRVASLADGAREAGLQF